MRRRVSTLALALVIGSAVPPGNAQDDRSRIDRPRRIKTTVAGPRFDLELPGRLLATAWVRDGLEAGGGTEGNGALDALLLVAPADDPDGPRHLLRWRPQVHGEHEPTTLATDLPADAEALAVHAADGVDVLLLGAPGRVERLVLGPVIERRTLWQAPGLDLRARPRDPGARLALAAPGQLALFEPGVPRPDRRLVAELPVRLRRTRAGIAVVTPDLATLPGSAFGGTSDRVFVVGPEAIGPTRLRTIIVDPEAATEETQRREIWSRLPGPETVVGHHYAVQDGRGRLLVRSVDAARVAIFGRQRLRSLPLLDDRSRSGKRTSIDVELQARHWQTAEIRVRDHDGNGRDDLVIVAQDGLGSGKLAVDIYPGLGGGRYAGRSRRVVLERAAEGWSYEHDLTGDGLPDLVIVGDDLLTIHPGRAAGKPVVKQALWAIPGSGDGSPNVLDVDGNGSLDVVMTTRNEDGHGRVRVLLRPRAQRVCSLPTENRSSKRPEARARAASHGRDRRAAGPENRPGEQ